MEPVSINIVDKLAIQIPVYGVLILCLLIVISINNLTKYIQHIGNKLLKQVDDISNKKHDSNTS